jgi:GT2 family glycosyltransferase
MSESITSFSAADRLVRSAYDRLRWRHTTLEPLMEIAPGARDRDTPEIELVTSRAANGVERSAITLPPGTEAVCSLHAPPRAEIAVDCGVEGPPGTAVRFTITTPGGSRDLVVTSGAGWSALRAAAVTAERRGTIIRFRTEVVAGDSAAVRPLWASPTLRWPRRAGEIGQLLSRALRQYGVRGMWDRIRAHGATLASDPDASYRAWRDARAPRADDLDRMRREALTLAPSPRFALLVIARCGAVSPMLDSIVRQVYPHWDAWLWPADGVSPSRADGDRADPRLHVLGAGHGTEADARNAVAAQSGAGLLLVVDAADTLAPDALFAVAVAAGAYPDAGVFYSDEDRLLADGPGRPQFKPGWSPELLLSRMYLGRLLAFRCDGVRDAGGYRAELDGAHDYDMALRLAARGAPVRHIPKVLYHRAAEGAAGCDAKPAEQRALEDICRQTGRHAVVVPGGAPRTWRVRHRLPGTPRVTIVIPTDARSGPTLSGTQPFIVHCLRSIVERTTYPHVDFVVVDNGVLPAAAADLLAALPHQRATYQWTGAFNFSRKINFAVARATGDLVLLLNDDVEVINADWLTAMLEYAGQDEIGAVGAKLFYPDGRLQHVGVATGVCGIAAHLLHQHPGGSTGCGHAAVAVRNCSAVTGACLLTRRDVYNQVGGFDERMAVDFNDVDFCLRVRAAGYRIVFTPYARLYHHESASFGSRVQHPRDTAAMRQIWGASLDRDPYYNPNLSRDFPDCRVAAR